MSDSSKQPVPPDNDDDDVDFEHAEESDGEEDDDFISGEDEEFSENELDNLEAENEMSVEELMKKYGYGGGGGNQEEEEQPGPSNKFVEQEHDKAFEENGHDRVDEDDDDDDDDNHVYHSSHAHLWLLNSDDHYWGEDDVEEDPEYDPFLDIVHRHKKEPRIGDEFQVPVPEQMSNDEAEKTEFPEGEILWSPEQLPETKVESFLNHFNACEERKPDDYVHDDERILSLLADCGYDLEEANLVLTQRLAAKLPKTTFSQEEMVNFEKGLEKHGKKFNLIKDEFFKDKSVYNLVNFYYYWKNSPREKEFRARIREKKELEERLKADQVIDTNVNGASDGDVEGPQCGTSLKRPLDNGGASENLAKVDLQNGAEFQPPDSKIPRDDSTLSS